VKIGKYDVENPWKQNPWFESVAVAQARAKKRLPAPVYGALVAGSERGQSIDDNADAFKEIQFAPHVAGHQPERTMNRELFGIDVSLPVLISPTGVQAVHPEGELAVARAAAARGAAIGLSGFASTAIEPVVEANPRTFAQLYWAGSREAIQARVERAVAAGARGIIVTLDWTFSHSRDWGSPTIPSSLDLKTMASFAPEVLVRPVWLARWLRTGRLPDLTVPNVDGSPGFFAAYGEWMGTPPPSWEDLAWLRGLWDGPFMVKGVMRADDARRVVEVVGATALSVSNHGGNNLDGTPAAIRALRPMVEAVGDQIEIVMDGGVRHGSDVVKALALGARAVMVGRPYLWALAAEGQPGVENVLDVFKLGIDSALLGLGRGSIHDLEPSDLLIPDGFHRHLG
jgi:pre-mycofactocin synthase